MEVQFSTAKNGEQTCSIDGKFLHSSYNPVRESETFASSQNSSIKPSCIIIIEPCLGLFCKQLREKFPQSKICAIRILSDFNEYDRDFDYVFYSTPSLQDELFNTLGEENLCTSHFCEWQNATRLFPDETKIIWNHIKTAVTKAKNVLITRSHFAQRWLKNTVNFFAKVQKGYSLQKTQKPVIIACSGPSLNGSIPFIKKFRKSFVLIAVSSAISPLLNNEIKPDLAISTDGGYWAKKHLEFDSSLIKDIPFALTPEGAFPSSLLKNCRIIPLTYQDGFENRYFSSLCKDFIPAKRNGTVSGTALQLALNWTENDVFLCGLDQASAKGFQHTNPNKIEEINSTKDHRINTKETRLVKSQYSSGESLEIYRQWFESFSIMNNSRIYRLSDNFSYSNSLGKIKSVNWDFFEAQHYKDSEEGIISKELIYKIEKKQIQSLISQIKNDSELKKELFPLELNVLEHTLNEEEKISINNKIKKQLDRLTEWLSCFESKFNI